MKTYQVAITYNNELQKAKIQASNDFEAVSKASFGLELGATLVFLSYKGKLIAYISENKKVQITSNLSL
jgi:hypothetical protein